MAHIEVVQTGARVSTHVRGRVYRNDFKPKHTLATRTSLKAKQRRRICVLSHHAALGLENWNISQPCFGPTCYHTHFTRDEVEQMVCAGDLRWVGNGQNVAAYQAPRFLAIRQSGPVTCVQLVES